MDEPGLIGSKYPARVVMVRAGKALVEHVAFHADESGEEKLREWCDCSLVTPRPPSPPEDFWKRIFVGQPAELLHEEGWWRVTIIGTPGLQDAEMNFEVHAENYNSSRLVPAAALRPRWELYLDANLLPQWRFDSKPPKLLRQIAPVTSNAAASDATSSTGETADAHGGVAVAPITNEDGLVTHAGGLALHLASESPTGYVGVHARGTRFLAKSWDDGSFSQIGWYDSAVEAAIAYAAYLAARDDTERNQVETHAEGWTLHLSALSNTGYKGVERKHQPKHRDAPYCAKLGRRTLGFHVTALSAAIDYAKAVAAGAENPSDRPTAAPAVSQQIASETECEDDRSSDEEANPRTTSQRRFVPRPPGRCPAGKEWDTSVGDWVPEGMSHGEVWIGRRERQAGHPDSSSCRRRVCLSPASAEGNRPIELGADSVPLLTNAAAPIAYAMHPTEGKSETKPEKKAKERKLKAEKKAEGKGQHTETLPLVDKVKLIQRELGIAEGTLIKQTIDGANETLGITPTAGQPIKEQVEVVLKQIAY